MVHKYRELFSEQEPFEGLPLKNIYTIVCQDQSRPKINSEWPESLQKLIRACWQNDPTKRPNIDDVINMFGNLKEMSMSISINT